MSKKTGEIFASSKRVNNNVSMLVRIMGINFAAVVTVCLLFSACASRKDLVYFQPDSVQLNTSFELNAPKLQPGDILAISVTADDVRATQPFNQVSPYQSGTIQSTNPFIPTYSIDVEGNIDFPKLGKLKLGGKTRTQAMELLRKEVGSYIVDPGISMEVRNFRVTVLGEVRSPGTYWIFRSIVRHDSARKFATYSEA